MEEKDRMMKGRRNKKEMEGKGKLSDR